MVNGVSEIHEIDSAEKLETYLRTRPAEEARVLAFRSAVRVMPFLEEFMRSRLAYRRKAGLIASVFRCILISWAAGNFPTAEISSVAEITYAADAYAASEAADYAAARAADAADATYTAAYSYDYVAAAAAARAADAAADAADDTDVFWTAIRSDLWSLRDVGASSALQFDLWADQELSAEFISHEDSFHRRILDFGAHWQPVWDFYSAVRGGRQPFAHLDVPLEKVIIGIATASEEFWKRDPNAIMKEISERLRGELREHDHDYAIWEEVTEQLVQTPADFRFSAYYKQPIDAIPFENITNNGFFAETTLAEAIGKAEEFLERLEQANVDPRLKRSVERLLQALPQQFEALNPALMRSKTRALEANAAAYISAGAEAELFPNAVADLVDLVGTLKDLQGCFPQIAEVERNTVAIDITGQEQEVEQVLNAITMSARELSAHYPAMVTTAAAKAVGILDDDISDAENQEVKRNLLAGAVLIKHNFLSAFYRKVLSPIGRESLRLGRLQYDAAIDGSVVSVRTASEKAFPAFVAYQIGGPLAAAAVFLPDVFKVLKQAKDATDNLTKGDNEGSDAE